MLICRAFPSSLDIFRDNKTNKTMINEKRTIIVIAKILFLFASAQSFAAIVTINEAGLDTVFSQPVFRDRQIDIRINPIVTIYNSDYLNVDTEAEYDELISQGSFGLTEQGINVYFVDNIFWCKGSGDFSGCSQRPGNNIVLRSETAKNSVFTVELLAHELGHNLGMGHLTRGPNLMSPLLNGETKLEFSQVARIFLSPLIQRDSNNNPFIELTPVLVSSSRSMPTPTPVPLPTSLLFILSVLLSGVGCLGLSPRRLG
jgi:hypothetical protein